MKIGFLRKISFVALLIISIPLLAQEDAQYEFDKDNGEISVLVNIDRKQLAKEDSIAELIASPPRIALIFPLKINFFDQGKWITLKDGRKVCKLSIYAPDSYGLIVRYSDFYLPEGAKLYVYNENNNRESWVFTHDENAKGGIYSNEIVSGDKITLEYVPSTISTESPRLDILEIGYRYRYVNEGFISFDKQLKNLDLKATTDCMININCFEGAFWQNQKKGVVRIRIRVGNSLNACSGSLVNNTAEDGTPYILTAYHCFFTASGELIQDASVAEFNFNYESKDCEGNDILPYQTVFGGDILIANPITGGSDGLLLKLKERLNPNWDVYYNGWIRQNEASNITSGAIIHHPEGGLKKITFYDHSPTSGEWDTNASAPKNTHWIITYSLGATAVGSSGSPMFDQNGLIIGTLTGGGSSCTNLNAPDYYGKFWYHWNQSADTTLHMSKYLDPLNGGTTQSLRGLSSSDVIAPQPDQQPELIVFLSGNQLNINSKRIIRRVTVFDLSGRFIFRQSTGLGSTTFSTSTETWNKGIYVVTVDADNSFTRSRKIIK